MKYRKIPKIKPSDKSLLQMQAPGGLYSEIALKFKIKQRKIDSDTKIFAFAKEAQRTITCAK